MGPQCKEILPQTIAIPTTYDIFTLIRSRTEHPGGLGLPRPQTVVRSSEETEH